MLVIIIDVALRMVLIYNHEMFRTKLAIKNCKKKRKRPGARKPEMFHTLQLHEIVPDGHEKLHDDTEENSERLSRFYDNNRQRFSATIAWFPFGRLNTIVELSDRYLCRLTCQLFKKVNTITWPASRQLQFYSRRTGWYNLWFIFLQ